MLNRRFQDQSIDLSADFVPNPVSGDIKVLKNKDSIFQHIDLLLMQDEDALIGRPGVCAGLQSLVFENFGTHEVKVLTAKIRNSLRFEPRINVTSIEVSQNVHDVQITIEFIFIETRKTYVYESTLRRVL